MGVATIPYMKVSRSMRLALTLCIPLLGHAGVVFTLSTGITGADTKINSSAESDWFASSFTPNCLVGAGNCTNVAVTQFNNIPVSYELGGGVFDIKESSNNTSDITFSLWDGNVGGTLGAPTGATLVASVTLSAGSVGGSYTPTAFTFATPVTLQAGQSYVATLTSSAPSNAGWFVKSPNSSPYTIQDPNGNPPPTVSATPEPSTAAMMAGALLALAGTFKRARRRS